MIANRTGYFLEPEWHIWLCAKIEFHVRVDRKRVKTFLANGSPVPVSPHESFIDGKARLLADGAGNRVQPPFHFLLSERNHIGSIAGGEKKSQPSSHRR